MCKYIGIDIGGTNIRIGIIDENNQILYLKKERTLNNVNNSNDLYLKICDMIKQVPNYTDCKAIGIGVPGAISNNKILTSRNLEYLKNFPLKEKLEKDFNTNVYIENDAKIATLGEATEGTGKSNNIVCYITISTGLGGGIVINNKIYYGSNNLGGYFSRMILDGRNIAENLISGSSLISKAKALISNNITKTEELFELYYCNETAKSIIDEFKSNLTILLLNISITINPDIIVIGGGVTNSKEYFLEEVMQDFYTKSHILAKSTKIALASLEEPGVIGAGIFAKINYEKLHS